MKIGDRVKLNTFNGRKRNPANCDPAENYWRLIGSTGTIVQDPSEAEAHASSSKKKRLLVKFDLDVSSLGLHCHNNVPNTLWILEKDLIEVRNENYKDRLKNAKSLHVGGPAADSRASLCLYAEEIDVESISTSLGCEPTEAHRRGDVIGRRRPAPIGLWSLDAPRDLSFEEKLEYLVKTTTSEHRTWDALADTHKIWLRCTIFLHSWTEGFDIPADIVAEIGRRHWLFGLSMYSAEGNEVVGAFLKKPSCEIPDDH